MECKSATQKDQYTNGAVGWSRHQLVLQLVRTMGKVAVRPSLHNGAHLTVSLLAHKHISLFFLEVYLMLTLAVSLKDGANVGNHLNTQLTMFRSTKFATMKTLAETIGHF